MEGDAPQVPATQEVQQSKTKDVPQTPQPSPIVPQTPPPPAGGPSTPTNKLPTKEKIKRFIKSPHVFAPILAYLILLGPTFYLHSGSPPETEVQTYKGAWIPHVLPNHFSKLKEMGMDTVFLQSFAGEPAVVQTAHRNGLKVALTLAIMGFDPPQAANLDLETFNSDIVKLAKFAEKYGVEFFAPANEPEKIFGEDTERWAQEILPKIKEVYSGEVIWKGADILDIDLSGYDYIGFRISLAGNMTPEKYTRYVDKQLDTALGFCEEIDTCKGIMVTEFGTRERVPGMHSEEDPAGAHEIVLERGKDKAVGFFYFDEVPGVFGEWEKEISKWYKEML